MTYLQFHFLFTMPLFGLMLWISRNNEYANTKKALTGMAVLLFLATSYTTPWDSYLIQQQIWTYEPGRVLGSLFLIPFEEYFFFIIQTLIGCCFTAFALKRFRAKKDHSLRLTGWQLISVGISFSFFASLAWLVTPAPPLRYLFLILVWALPILLLQLSLGLTVLKKEKKVWALSVTCLTAYFCLADSFAIQKEIWTFPTNTISGWKLFSVLPIEEALFFLVTNLMVVQGFILFTTVDFSKFQWTGFNGESQ